MAQLPLLKTSESDKLETLRRLDRFRRWRCLEDKRYCLCCGKIITGAEIQIARGTDAVEPARLFCPTPACESIPMDWVLPTDEVLSTMSMLGDEKTQVAAAVHQFHRSDKSVGARLQRFKSHLRRSA
jgi:hypothetical protein